jgi:IS30 family transposase
MLQKHITINELTNIHIYFLKGINANQCSRLMNIGKDKAYHYFNLFKKGFTVLEIFDNYKENKSKCGRKKLIFTQDKCTEINELLDKDWSVDAICGRDKLVESEERCSTKTLYRMVKDSLFSESKLRRKGKGKKNYQKETREKINDCKTIHERDKKYPKAKLGIEFGHFEGDTIVGQKRKTAIVTLVERQSK